MSRSISGSLDTTPGSYRARSGWREPSFAPEPDEHAVPASAGAWVEREPHVHARCTVPVPVKVVSTFRIG